MKHCKDCGNFGYVKENGQYVCRWALNFNQKHQAYQPEFAARCKDFALPGRAEHEVARIVLDQFCVVKLSTEKGKV